MDPISDNDLSTRSHVVRQLIVVFTGLLMVVLIVGLGALYRIAGSLDQREMAQSRFHAESAMAQLQKNERSYVLTHAIWQSAFDHLGRGVDVQWAYDEDNVGPTLFTADGYVGVFVLDDDGSRYAMVDGQLSDASFAHYSPQADLILSQARQVAAKQQATSGYFQFGGQPALYTAAVIQPPSMPHHLPAPSAVLVFVRRLDASLLEPLGRAAGLSGFAVSDRMAADGAKGRLALEGSGHTLTWHIERPGSELVSTVVPALALAGVLIGLLMTLFARYAIRASTGMDRSHEQLAASKAALETSEERFRAVAEASSDWIWETDADLHLSYLSARFAELTGHKADAWLHRPITELLDCDTAQLENWLHGLAASHATGSLRCQYHDHLGQQRICRIAARASFDRGVCKGFRGTSSDITDEVAAHAQIQHLSLHDALGVAKPQQALSIPGTSGARRCAPSHRADLAGPRQFQAHQ